MRGRDVRILLILREKIERNGMIHVEDEVMEDWGEERRILMFPVKVDVSDG